MPSITHNQTGAGNGYDLRPPPVQGIRDALFAPGNYNVLAKRLIGNPTVGTAVGAQDYDFREIATVERHFTAVQLVMLSCEAANNVVGFTASITPSASFASLLVPTGTPVVFTWGGAGSTTLPVGTASLYTALASDWMTCASLPRTDAPPFDLPIYFLNMHIPTGPGTYTYTRDVSNGAAFNTDPLTNFRRWYRFAQANIDSVITPANFTSVTDQSSMLSHIIRFRCRGRALTMAVIGDSIAAGGNTTSNCLGYGQTSAWFLSSAGMPIEQVNVGWQGQTSANYLANGKAIVTAIQPQVAFYQVCSTNDGSMSTAIAAAQFAQALDFVAHCRLNNTLPVLITPSVSNVDSLFAFTTKRNLGNEILRMAGDGILVCDMFNQVCDFGKLSSVGAGQWKTGLNQDSIHLLDGGASFIRDNVIKPVMDRIITANLFDIY